MKEIVARKHIVVLGLSAIIFVITTVILFLFNTERLSVFGPLATLYFNGLRDGFLESAVFLVILFTVLIFCERQIGQWVKKVAIAFERATSTKKAVLVLLASFIIAFAIHSTNVLNGYFLNDDFEVVGVNRLYSVSDSLTVPHGDHTIPLFRLEMNTLLDLFGQNPLPFNFFVFFAFALVPFFTYLIFRRLGLGMLSFIAFFIIYVGATSWADILTGYYDISTYLQISFFCTVSIWGYIGWKQSGIDMYLLAYAFGVLAALFIDLPGIWVYPVLLLLTFVFFTFQGKNTTDIALRYIQENKKPLLILAVIGILFAVFMAYNFQASGSKTFVNTTDDSKSSFIRYSGNMMKFYSTTLTQALLIPNVVKIVGHPSIIEKVRPVWLVLDIILFFMSIYTIVYIYRHADARRKRFIVWILLSLFILLTLIVVKRPINDFVFDADFKYGAMPYYFYSILIVLFLTTLVERNKISVPMCMVLLALIFSTQNALGFEAIKKSEEGKARRIAVESFGQSFFGELEKIHGDLPLAIPNLAGNFIYREIAASLADYVLFFNVRSHIKLLENSAMRPDTKTKTVTRVQSLRAATDKAFIEALKKSETLRSYYFYPVRMSHETYSNGATSTKSFTQAPVISKYAGHDFITLQSFVVDPEENHIVTIEFETTDIPGNLELSFYFNNDFGVTDRAGYIKVDDSIGYIRDNGKRYYHLTTDLLQLYSYSLSTTVSNIRLLVPEKKDIKIIHVDIK
jgi:hypothetical protein